MKDPKKITMAFITVRELKEKQNIVIKMFELFCLCLNIHESLEMVSGTSLPW